MFLKTSLATVLLCTFSILSAQVTSVSYLLEYNNSTCEYDFSIITEGAAVTNAQRFQLNSQITFLTKAGTTLSITQKYQPMTLQPPVQPNNWSVNVIAEAPAEDPLHDYYTVGPTLSPTSRYPILADGDTTKLFSLIVTPAVYGIEGLRLLDINADPTDIAGSDFSHGFTIGSLDQLYTGNVPQVYPEDIGQLTGPATILIGENTSVSPAFTSAWSSTDPTIVSVDFAGNVAGYAQGTSTLEYSPPSGCHSAVEVTVVDAANLIDDRVSIGTDTPDLSAILDIVSSDKGLLLPRLSSAQRVAIPSPAEGLMIYQTSVPQGLYLNTSNGWQKLSVALDNSSTNQLQGDGETQSLRSTGSSHESAQLRKEIDILKAELNTLKKQLNDNR